MEKKCGFKWDKPCNKECKYFDTCTRNPHRKYVKKAGGVYKALPAAVEESKNVLCEKKEY